MSGRTLEELAAAAVEASQTKERTLDIDFDEYQTLARPDVEGQWSPIVARLALERGLSSPLPVVKVIVNTSAMDEAEAGWLAMEQYALEQGWDD